MSPSDLRDRAERLMALSRATLCQKTSEELAFLAAEYAAAARDSSNFPIRTVFPD